MRNNSLTVFPFMYFSKFLLGQGATKSDLWGIHSGFYDFRWPNGYQRWRRDIRWFLGADPVSGPQNLSVNLLSQEEYSVYFAQIIFNLPQHWDTDKGIRIEQTYAGRKFEKQSDGSISLGWNTHIYPGSPYQIGESIFVNQMIFEVKNQIIHLELIQNWYDHASNEWRETSINYQLKKSFNKKPLLGGIYFNENRVILPTVIF